MKLSTLAIAVTTLITVGAGTAQAADGGLVSTDRFGYEGTITRYNTLAEAQLGGAGTQNINVMDRDLSLYFASNDSTEADYNYMGGSWWYTTNPNGVAGWGNEHGNTGVGFLQLADADASTDSSISMDFSNFSGGYYTQFDLSVSGSGANAADAARLSAFDNLNDGGIWHSYSLNLTATGLQGLMTAPGIIESNNEPVGVSGSITAIFEITENQTNGDSIGFYAVDFSLNMNNWAFDNQNDLTGAYSFAPSFFRTVPTPGSAAVLAMSGLFASRRRRA